MKKYLFLFIAMLMSVSAFTLVGCSSDDDDEQDGSGNNNGKVSVKYEGATTENYSVQQATFELFSQSVEGSTHYDYDNGATFHVTFTDGDNYYTYWQFQSRENIKAGQKLAVSAIFFGDDSGAQLMNAAEMRLSNLSMEIRLPSSLKILALSVIQALAQTTSKKSPSMVR